MGICYCIVPDDEMDYPMVLPGRGIVPLQASPVPLSMGQSKLATFLEQQLSTRFTKCER